MSVEETVLNTFLVVISQTSSQNFTATHKSQTDAQVPIRWQSNNQIDQVIMNLTIAVNLLLHCLLGQGGAFSTYMHVFCKELSIWGVDH